MFRACSREHACSSCRIQLDASLPLGGWFLLFAESDLDLMPPAQAVAED